MNFVNNINRLSKYFCSDTVFNLTKKVLLYAEMQVLEKGLDYVPIKNVELRRDVENSCS